jgi:hypothetical protein
MVGPNKLLNRRSNCWEKTFAWKLAATPSPSPAPQIAQWLASIGIVWEGNESLAETTARAFGISIPNLRERLQRRAPGLST